MCGIVAALGNRDVSGALALLKHRGVRSKIHTTEAGSVGHVRLPIVGLSEAFDQPVREGKWVIAFVGEVLDFRDERPSDVCDLPLVVESWLRDGPHGLTSNDGFWAVVALDTDRNRLHVLCDYLAQKPMYYRTDMPAVASEPDALASMGPVTPDEVYMAAVLKWGYCPDTTRTPYSEMKHVLPGEHVILFENGQAFREIVDPLTPVAYTPQMMRNEIEGAVRRRVTSSDVPVALLLSGGLDSSIVYSIARKHGRVRPYYVREKHDGRTDVLTREEKNIESLLRPGDPATTEVEWGTVSIADGLAAMQEPVDLGSLLPQLALSETVQEDVCLTGDGADELFGGYGRAMRYDSQYSDIFQEMVAWHLPRLDRVMMRNCVEIRSPFLARQVVQGAMALPYEERRAKIFLRRLFRDQLADIADTPKAPLRTKEIEEDREKRSKLLVKMFRKEKWK